MDLIKNFFKDKVRLGVAIVCLLMLSVAIVSSVTGNTMAALTVKVNFILDADEEIDGETLREYIVGEPYEELPIATKPDYKFEGWYTYLEDDTVEVLITEESIVSADITWLLPKWSKDINENDNVSTVTFNANGGDINYLESKISATVGEEYGTMPTPTRTGYMFLGWFTEREGGTEVKTTSIVPSENHTLYAHWEGISYKVKYDSNGGSGTMADSNHTYGTPSNLTANIFTRENYTFNGWNTEANGTGTSYTDTQSITNLTTTDGHIITLYAQWKDNSNDNEEIVVPNDTEVSLTLSNAYKDSLDLIVNVVGLTENEGATCKIYLIPMEDTGYPTGESKVVATINNCKNGDNSVKVSDLSSNTKYAFQVELLPEVSNTSVGKEYVTFATLEEDNNEEETSTPPTTEEGNDNLDDGDNPDTGSLATILVTLIGIGAIGGIFYYRKKIKI